MADGTAERVKINALGPLVIERPHPVEPVVSAQARLLLVLLAVKPKYTRQEIVDFIWPGEDVDNADHVTRRRVRDGIDLPLRESRQTLGRAGPRLRSRRDVIELARGYDPTTDTHLTTDLDEIYGAAATMHVPALCDALQFVRGHLGDGLMPPDAGLRWLDSQRKQLELTLVSMTCAALAVAQEQATQIVDDMMTRGARVALAPFLDIAGEAPADGEGKRACEEPMPLASAGAASDRDGLERADESRSTPGKYPRELVEALSRGTVALFIGAGVSVGSGLPDWSGLNELLANELLSDEMLSDVPRSCDGPTLARYVEVTKGRLRLVQLVTAAVGRGKPNAIHEAIVALGPKIVYTTNYDELLESAFRATSKDCTFVAEDKDVSLLAPDGTQVIKIHGSTTRPVISTVDFEQFSMHRPRISGYLETHLRTYTVLFLGYSVSDPDFRILLTRVQTQAGEYARNLYSLTFDLHPLEDKDLAARQIRCIQLRGVEPAGRTRAVADWLNGLSAQVESERIVKAPAEALIDKRARTRLVIEEAERARDSSNSTIIRMRQGFGPLSLGDDEYDDEEYSRLLQGERDSMLAALRAGCDMRVIVTKRPVFSSDMAQRSVSDKQLVRRMQERCANLIRVVEDYLSTHTESKLLMAYSPVSGFAEYGFGDRVLISGSHIDSSSGYGISWVMRGHHDIDPFIEAFDLELDRLTGGAVSEISSTKRVLDATRDTLLTLRRIELELEERT